MKLLQYIKHKNYRHFFGLMSEYIAIIAYILRFYTILSHRYKSKLGEIDFIAKRGNRIIFVEVKARRCGLEHGIVSIHQQQRIRRAAELFLLRNKQYSACEIRFDLVVLNKFCRLTIIKNAF